MNLIISEEHEKALKAINDDYFRRHNLEEIVSNLIEEYIFRENGRIGYFSVVGKYIKEINNGE